MSDDDAFILKFEQAKLDLVAAEAKLAELCRTDTALAFLASRWRDFNVPGANGLTTYCGDMAAHKPALDWQRLPRGQEVRAAALACHDKLQVLRNVIVLMPWGIRQRLEIRDEDR